MLKLKTTMWCSSMGTTEKVKKEAKKVEEGAKKLGKDIESEVKKGGEKLKKKK